MNAISIVVLIFSLIGALDFIFGKKFGVGAEFEKAFALFGAMALSTLGMLVIAPAVGVWLTPVFEIFYKLFGIDPSVIPASLFANDMGGMALAQTLCKTEAIGDYNAFIVSSMMGCVISFTIPISLGMVKQEQYKDLFFGLLCGIVTVPVGCFVAGLICKMNVLALIINLLPLIILGLIVGAGLIFVPKICIKCFEVFGIFMKTLGVIGLAVAVFTFLTGIELDPNLGTLQDASFVCVNACVTLSGALPLMYIVAKVLRKPLAKVGSLIGINEVSILAFIGSLATNVTTFGMMDKMNRKGVVLNAAFAVSASFVFSSHLAFTMMFNESYLVPMMVGKLVSGVCAVILALLIYKENKQEA